MTFELGSHLKKRSHSVQIFIDRLEKCHIMPLCLRKHNGICAILSQLKEKNDGDAYKGIACGRNMVRS